MGTCYASVHNDEMGIFDGRQRDGIEINQKFISYFHIESALLDYPGVIEAGVVAACTENRQHILKVYLALEEPLASKEDIVVLCEKIQDFLCRHFNLDIPIVVQVHEKLPMTRSGKILRNVLREWE